MSDVRKMLKIVSRAILALGLAGAVLVLLAPLLLADPHDRSAVLQQVLACIPGAVVLALTAVLASGVVRLLVSIDERLEQLVKQTGGG